MPENMMLEDIITNVVEGITKVNDAVNGVVWGWPALIMLAFVGVLMIPNLIGVLVLSPLVFKITKNYVDRVLRGKNEKPMLSAITEVQEEQEKKVGA